MGSSKDRKPAKASSRKKTSGAPPKDTRTPWWQKPFLWVGGVVLIALGAALNAPLQFTFGRIIENFAPDIGDPVSAVVSLEHSALHGVSLPRAGALSDQDLESLRSMGSEQQVSWLMEKRDGIPLSYPQLRLELKSNRPHPVRVTDIQPVSTCEEPSRGSLVKTVLGGVGNASNSIVFRLYADRPGSGAEVVGPGKEQQPFFPNRTITLAGEEREYLVLNLEASATKLCRLEVELKVVDGDKEVRQTISPGRKVALLPFTEVEDFEDVYSSVYLAGTICNRPVLAPKNYRSNVGAACGPGNLGSELTQGR
ncbi:hypothetical protein [Arthrobacter sp. ov118]|uniref:hypothetical protein n=1 Tax=Arthrobacter sp. ov118 TaxID=1761747 RepID=UPI0008F06BD2|nr:hypothetical protein [Arthrobacter sp. ov118]SFU13865.1 hypothetical protein SAMN04487915_1139 [Arthrobacter sp. ov118]